MTKWQRIKSVFIGILMIFIGVLMVFMGAEACSLIMIILSLSLTISGLKMLIYYFTMARHMVGGDQILIRGMIIFDLGAIAETLTNISQIYIMGYLLAIHAFSGFVEILREVKKKRLDSPGWKLKFSTGIVNIILAVICIVFLRSTSIAVYLYSAGLIYSAIIRIISAFRKTAVVFITPS